MGAIMNEDVSARGWRRPAKEEEDGKGVALGEGSDTDSDLDVELEETGIRGLADAGGVGETPKVAPFGVPNENPGTGENGGVIGTSSAAHTDGARAKADEEEGVGRRKIAGVEAEATGGARTASSSGRGAPEVLVDNKGGVVEGWRTRWGGWQNFENGRRRCRS